MFQIKICGITTVEDALLAAEAGADAIGLNFYEKSPRYAWQAEQIAGWTPDTMKRIGVFVNPTIQQLEAVVQNDAVLDGIQLHGDEPPEFLEQVSLLHTRSHFDHYSVVKAFRWNGLNEREVGLYLGHFLGRAVRPSAVLIDAFDPHAYGGTGRTADWHHLAQHKSAWSGYPLILAGGLTPDNVAEAITTARPDAVDVASGVESAPGKKDPAKVRDFVAAAKEAFATLR